MKPIFGLWLAIGAISTAAILIRFAQSNLASITIAAFRLLLSSLFYLPFFITKNFREIKKGVEPNIAILVLLSGIFLALHFYSWVTSLEFTKVTSSVVLVTTTPIWVSIISILLFKDKMRRGFWMGLLVTVIGTLVITGAFSDIFRVTSSQNQVFLGNLLALFGAWCAAGYVVTGKRIRQTLSNGSYIFLVYTCSGLILLIIAVFSRQSLSVVSFDDWLWLILLALIPQLIGHTLINWSLGYLPAPKVSIALLGEPVGASILALLFLGEIPELKEIIGGLLIVGGIYLALISDSERIKRMPKILVD